MNTTLNYEGFMVGQRIRAMDFEISPGRPLRYIEGRIESLDGDRYKIVVDTERKGDSFLLKGANHSRIGSYVWVPMDLEDEDWDNRVTLLELTLEEMKEIFELVEELTSSDFINRPSMTTVISAIHAISETLFLDKFEEVEEIRSMNNPEAAIISLSKYFSQHNGVQVWIDGEEHSQWDYVNCLKEKMFGKHLPEMSGWSSVGESFEKGRCPRCKAEVN